MFTVEQITLIFFIVDEVACVDTVFIASRILGLVGFIHS